MTILFRYGSYLIRHTQVHTCEMMCQQKGEKINLNYSLTHRRKKNDLFLIPFLGSNEKDPDSHAFFPGDVLSTVRFPGARRSWQSRLNCMAWCLWFTAHGSQACPGNSAGNLQLGYLHMCRWTKKRKKSRQGLFIQSILSSSAKPFSATVVLRTPSRVTIYYKTCNVFLQPN